MLSGVGPLGELMQELAQPSADAGGAAPVVAAELAVYGLAAGGLGPQLYVWHHEDEAS